MSDFERLRSSVSEMCAVIEENARLIANLKAECARLQASLDGAIVLRGWRCSKGHFTGEEKEPATECRLCGEERAA